MMKRFVVCMTVLGAMATFTLNASASYVVTGDQVRVENNITTTTNGGPFTMTIEVPNGRQPFETFCLELSEIFVPNTLYDVTVGLGAINGGNGGGNPDYLDPKTAYLYKTYRNGGLADVASLGWTGDLSQKAAVQDAIWYLEDELTSLSPTSYAATLVTWLETLETLGTGVLDTASDVRVANLWDVKTGAARQSMLTLVPEPGSVLVWSFIVSVFGGAFYLRRRRAGA